MPVRSHSLKCRRVGKSPQFSEKETANRPSWGSKPPLGRRPGPQYSVRANTPERPQSSAEAAFSAQPAAERQTRETQVEAKTMVEDNDLASKPRKCGRGRQSRYQGVLDRKTAPRSDRCQGKTASYHTAPLDRFRLLACRNTSSRHLPTTGDHAIPGGVRSRLNGRTQEIQGMVGSRRKGCFQRRPATGAC